MSTIRNNKKITGSLIAGALLVPLTAVAAAALVGSITNAQNAEAVSVAPVTMVIEQLTTTPSAVPASDTTITACTSGAEKLISAERDGTIDPLQTAALDALRQICEAEGLAIAGPPTPEPVVTVVTVNQPASSYDQGGDLVYDDSDDDHHDDDHDKDHDDDHDKDHDDDHHDQDDD